MLRVIRVRRIPVIAAALLLLVAAFLVPATRPATGATSTAHYIANLDGSTAPAALGYDVFDTGPSGVNSLPAGVRALVWLGQKCPTAADASFRATIDALATNPRVFGYYLSDEPHIADCPGGPAALKSRTDYVRSKTSTQYTFVVLDDEVEMSPFRPAVTGVHLIGLDPYPCSTANPTCDLSKIGQRVGWADAAGIPRSAIVPTFQCFGQENFGGYYRLPTADQLRAMLAEWSKFVPTPVMDYTYSWGNQPDSSDPTLVDSPALQAVMAEHNAVVTPPPTTTTTTTLPTTTTTTLPTTTSTTTSTPTRTKKPHPTHPRH
ncbi:MAG TPA: hypothetical protein VIT65_20530 [Microlunatus sp.]